MAGDSRSPVHAGSVGCDGPCCLHEQGLSAGTHDGKGWGPECTRSTHTAFTPRPQDNVSPVSDAKRTATAVAVLTAILVLVPMAPEVAQSIGVGRVDTFF